jgi:hypothetical protein
MITQFVTFAQTVGYPNAYSNAAYQRRTRPVSTCTKSDLG